MILAPLRSPPLLSPPQAAGGPWEAGKAQRAEGSSVFLPSYTRTGKGRLERSGSTVGKY